MESDLPDTKASILIYILLPKVYVSQIYFLESKITSNEWIPGKVEQINEI